LNSSRLHPFVKSFLIAIIAAPVLAAAAPAKTGSALRDWAATPPMGWNSWDCFGTRVNEELTKANADYMSGHLKPLSLITNPEVLAVNQASSKGRQLFRNDDLIAWVADVPGCTDKYLALFNARDTRQVSTDKAAFSSGLVSHETPGHAVDVDVDLQGAGKLFLVVDDGGEDFDCDHVVWIEPRLGGPGGEKKLTELPWASATAGWGKAGINANASGGKLVVDKQAVAFGIGTHAPSVIEFDLPAGYTGFKARAGLEKDGVDQGRGTTVGFYVVTTDPRPPGAGEGIPIPVEFAALGFVGPCKVRDLWQRTDLDAPGERFSPTIKPHAAGLYQISGRQADREQDHPGK
jgi:hypothetical protein